MGGAGILGADLGWVTMIGLPVCLVLAVVSHFFSKWLNRKDFTMLPTTAKSFAEFGTEKADAVVADAEGDGTSGASGAFGTATKTRTVAPPSAGMVMTLIVTPLIMIALGTIGATLLPAGDPIRNVLAFIGAPLFALLVTVLLASFFLGIRRGWSASQLGDVVEAALPPVAVVILVTGGGGAFARVLTESGIGAALSETLLATGMPLMLMAYLISLALPRGRRPSRSSLLRACSAPPSSAADTRRSRSRCWPSRSRSARSASRTSTTPGSGSSPATWGSASRTASAPGPS